MLLLLLVLGVTLAIGGGGRGVWSTRVGNVDGIVGGWSKPALSTDGATIFVGANDVHALNTADGSVVWSTTIASTDRNNPTFDFSYSSPILSSDGATLFIGSSRDNCVYAFKTADGSVVWTYETGSQVYGSPTLSPDGVTLFIGSDDNNVYALKTADGSLVWKYITGACSQYNRGFCTVRGKPALSPDGATLFAVSYDKNVYALETADGSLVWKYQTGMQHVVPILSPDGAMLFAAGAAVTVNPTSTNVHALKTADGSVAWTSQPYTTGEKYGVSSAPTLSRDGAMLFLPSYDNTMFALKAADGSLVWKWTTVGYQGDLSTPVLSPDNTTLFVTTRNSGNPGNNNVHALNAAGGSNVWGYTTQSLSGARGSPALSPDGTTLFTASSNYNMYAIKVDTTTPWYITALVATASLAGLVFLAAAVKKFQRRAATAAQANDGSNTGALLPQHHVPHNPIKAGVGTMHSCGHMCELWADHCCVDMDTRPEAEGYEKYVDGVGHAKTATREEGYCQVCRAAYRAAIAQSFQSSNYKRAYDSFARELSLSEFAQACFAVVHAHAKRHDKSTGAAQAFCVKIASEWSPSDKVPTAAQKVWTSGTCFQGCEFCSIFSEAVRDDHAELAPHVALLARALNADLVTSGRGSSIGPMPYPLGPGAEGRERSTEAYTCWRGGGFWDNPRTRAFFVPGRRYRVPQFLATSFHKEVALAFIARVRPSDGVAKSRVLWKIKLDPVRGCGHVRHITKDADVYCDECEFLFTAFSAFEVLSVNWRYGGLEPHEITIRAAADNRDPAFPEDLPVAPWC
jgi:outer membrane protein assembly factor BamB